MGKFSRLSSSGPKLDAEQHALKSLEAFAALATVDGARLGYHGPALEWQLSQSNAIALEFQGPWFSDRSIEMHIWSTSPVILQVSSPAIGAPAVIPVAAPSTITSFTLKVLAHYPGRSDNLRVSIGALNPVDPAARIYFALAGGGHKYATRLINETRLNSPLVTYLCTWVNLFSLLFILLSWSGLRGFSLTTTTLPLLPTILDRLGFRWAGEFNAGKLALWIDNALSRWLKQGWCFLSFPLLAIVGFIFVGLYYYSKFESTLTNHLERTDVTLAERVAFFCDFPERLEPRVLLSRSLETIGEREARVQAYKDVLEQIDVDRLLRTCLSPNRVLPRLIHGKDRAQVHARVLYASFLWNPIQTVAEFEPSLKAIRRVLDVPQQLPGALLAKAALVKYELKAIKNANEHEYCRMETETCIRRRAECLEARQKLQAVLAEAWEPGDRQSLPYIEARDVAASSHMSIGCSREENADIDAVIVHYRALANNLPGSPRFEQTLGQLNIRKFLDGLFMTEPDHETSQSWKRECGTVLPKTCKRIQAALLADRSGTFFSPETEKRAQHWDRTALPYLDNESLQKRLLEERERGWTWPL